MVDWTASPTNPESHVNNVEGSHGQYQANESLVQSTRDPVSERTMENGWPAGSLGASGGPDVTE